jgi:hypothetical protein
MYLANAGSLPNSMQPIFYPALFIASKLRIGAHDAGIVFTIFLVDSVLFGAMALFLDILIFRKKPANSATPDQR